MATTDSKNRATELVKAVLDAGLFEPGNASGWLHEPEKNGEALGKLIAAAVKAAARELDKS
ncbi:hypothetical protein [Burkholderia gladioli]|uniref:hypothetical protein n=1 Tax=Burkholderia gladioli TaxID=28095 RepID=UPI001640AFB7|nr:hypothetical protein [Burkholderia gladioli]